VKYKIRTAAERDIDAAADWYRETSTDPRVAVRFLLEVRAAFETIAESPHAFPQVRGDVRRYRLLAAFAAYSIFYRVIGDVVVITAVFHGRRHPSIWERRR
jgi:plasmid stabilization system protein ParE